MNLFFKKEDYREMQAILTARRRNMVGHVFKIPEDRLVKIVIDWLPLEGKCKISSAKDDIMQSLQ